MKKNPQVYLTHILQATEAIERYLEGVSKETFLESEEKQDLTTRRLEIIGEAVKQLPDEFKNQHPQIPWRDIGDMRNVLIHVYFDIDYSLVWRTATELVPELKQEIKLLLKKESQ